MYKKFSSPIDTLIFPISQSYLLNFKYTEKGNTISHYQLIPYNPFVDKRRKKYPEELGHHRYLRTNIWRWKKITEGEARRFLGERLLFFLHVGNSCLNSGLIVRGWDTTDEACNSLWVGGVTSVGANIPEDNPQSENWISES